MLAAALAASTLSIAEQRADQVVRRAPMHSPTLPFSPLGSSGILCSRDTVSRAARILVWAQCMAMLEPWPTVSFLPHPPARKRFPLIRPGKLSYMHRPCITSIYLMTSTLVTPSELPVIRYVRGISCITWLDHTGLPWTRTVLARFVKPSRGSSTWLEIVSLPRCHHSMEARAW